MSGVEGSGFVLRRNWVPLAVCAVLVVVGVLVARASYLYAPFGWFGVVFGGIFGPLCVTRNAFPTATPTTFRATEGGISIEGVGQLSGEDILECKVVPRGGTAVVSLALRSRPSLSLRVDTQAARAIAQALGARRSQFRLVIPFGKRFLGAFLALSGLFLLAFVLPGGADGVLPAVFPAVFCGLFYGVLVAWFAGLLRGRLVIGADGLTTRWLLWERFVAFRDVTAVTGRTRLINRHVEDTLVELRDGRTLRLRTLEAPNTEEERGAESRAMLAHVALAHERAARLAAGAVDVPALVKRSSRSARDWLSGLDAIVRGGGSRYRVAAVSPEMLADVVADASAAPDARVGAAAALVRLGDESMRARVRISGDACAHAGLRQALGALADARDDDAVAAALDAFRT